MEFSFEKDNYIIFKKLNLENPKGYKWIFDPVPFLKCSWSRIQLRLPVLCPTYPILNYRMTPVLGLPNKFLTDILSRNFPRGIGDQGKQLFFINKLNPDVDVSGMELFPMKDSVIKAEYYQPDHFLVTLGVNVTNGASACQSCPCPLLYLLINE